MNAIDFYFDFSSPYGYFASLQVEAVAARHGRSVAWRPILLGPAFQATGIRPQAHVPMRREYFLHDGARYARLLGVPYRLPEPFPTLTVAPARAFYYIAERAPAQAVPFAQAVFAAYYGEGQGFTDVAQTLDAAERTGFDRNDLAAALQRPEVKGRLKSEVDEALGRGVFGSPFFFVDGEPFWGSDRLAQVDRWLETGGW